MRRQNAAMRASVLLLLTATVVQAQRPPARPRLAPDADTNDAVAYFQAGLARLAENPDDAAAAFYWSGRLDPSSPQILYARHTALLMTYGNRLMAYMRREPRALRHPDIRRIDSLYYRALMLEPFLVPGLEEQLLLAWMRREIAADQWSYRMWSMPESDLLGNMDTVLSEISPHSRGVLAYSRGQPEHALLYYREALRRRRANHAGIHANRAQAYFALRQLDSARAAMTRAIDTLRAQDTSEIRFVYESKAGWECALGRITEERGDLAAAREAYERALIEDLAYFPAHQRLGQMALREGDTARAVTEFERAVRANENEYLSRAYLGAMLGRLGRARDAVPHLSRATELEPWAAATWLLLGREHDRAADTTAALAAYDRYLALSRRADPPRTAVRARAGELRAARSRP